MASNGLPVDRLRDYLRELKPEARALLMAELERGRLRGEELPAIGLILHELREAAPNERARPPPPPAAPLARAAGAPAGFFGRQLPPSPSAGPPPRKPPPPGPRLRGEP